MKINFTENNTLLPLELELFNESLNQLRSIIMQNLNQGHIPTFTELISFIDSDHLEENGINIISNISKWYQNLFNSFYLYPFLENQNIKEIIIHHPQLLQYENNHNLHTADIDGWRPKDYQLYFDLICSKQHISWNYSYPFCSFLSIINNYPVRITLIHHSMTPEKVSKIFIRKIQSKTLKLSDFHTNQQIENDLIKYIYQKKNIIICGGTSSGKTSLLNVIIKKIPSDEHTIIIEDVHELISEQKEITHFLATDNNPNKSAEQYCAYALRLRPDRIILGEIRSKEIIPFFLAMNTGHQGLLCTLHANSAQDAIERMALLFSIHSEYKNISFDSLKTIIAKNIDYIIYMEQRKIVNIISTNSL